MKEHLTKRTVDAANSAGKTLFVWDLHLKGFGLKITPAGKKVYLVQARLNRHLRRFTIGRHGSPWTCEQARTEAKRIIGSVASGVDPSRPKSAAEMLSLTDLTREFAEFGRARKKPHTIEVEESLIKRHIIPLLGKKRLAIIKQDTIQLFMNAVAEGRTAADERTGARGRAIVRGGKGAANRSFDILSSMFTLAITRGYRTDNPTSGLRKFKLQKRERLLSDQEVSNLHDALRAAESGGRNPVAIAAIRFLMLTGCRKNEVLTLQWEWIDFERGLLRLPESKTGSKVVPVGGAALDVLRTIPTEPRSEYVFPSRTRASPYAGLEKVWHEVRSAAGMPTLRLHDLRHHFVSVGVSEGESLYLLGKIVGHSSPQTTQRYAHVHSGPISRMADRISQRILMGTKAA